MNSKYTHAFEMLKALDKELLINTLFKIVIKNT